MNHISYAISRRTSDAFEQIRGTYLSFNTVKELTNALQAAFGDRNLRGTAQRQLATLRQGNLDVSHYRANFTWLSKRLTMTEETKFFSLRTGRSPVLKEEIRV